MSLFDINGWEFVLLAVRRRGRPRAGAAARVRRQAARAGPQVRAMADAARDQVREQMGPEFDDIDWQQFDPRRYDPRRIVREALLDDDDDVDGPVKGESGGSAYDPARPTPYDTDAT